MKNVAVSLVVLAGIMSIELSFAENTVTLPPVSAYGKLPEVSLMEISPSGMFIAFRKISDDMDALLVTSLETNNTIYAVDVSSIKPRKIDFVTDRHIILTGSDTINYYGWKREFSIVYVIDLKKKKIRKILEPGGSLGVIQTGLGGIVGISPERDMLFMSAYYSDIKGGERNPDFSLLRVPINRRMSPFVHEPGSSLMNDFVVDKNGKALVKTSYNEKSNLYQLFSRQDNEWKEIYREESELEGLDIAGISADGKRLFVSEDLQDVDSTGYKTLALTDGGLQGLYFHRDNVHIQEGITDIQRVVYGVRYSGFEQSYEFLDLELNRKISSIVNSLPGNGVWLSSWTPDWKSIIFRVEGELTPGAFILFQNDKKPRKLANLRPEIQQSDLRPVVALEYKSRDGLAIPTLLTLPSRDPKMLTNLPTILLPHGGPASHDEMGFDWIAQYFASRGYFVVQPQFRGSHGFGARHKVAGKGEWGRKMQNDLTDAVKYFIKEGYSDPGRVCIVGASYGGYAALAGGAFTPDLYKCVVSIAGISDLEGFFKSEKWKYGKDSAVISYWSILIGEDTVSNKDLYDLSAVNFAENFRAPVLLVHGADDTVVPFDQSKTMYKALKSAGKKVELAKLKGEDHWLSIGDTRIQMLETVSRFVDNHLKSN